MGKVSSREQEVLEVLKHRRKLETAEIVERFSISESTARRLCASLERQGKVIRGVGGIYRLPEPGLGDDYEYDRLVSENAPQKDRIGRHAGGLLEEGDIIFLSGGTTVARLARHLAQRLARGELRRILVTTNSVINAELLAPHAKVLLIGGEYRPRRRDVAGPMSERMISGARFNKCFLGVDAIDVDSGLMVFDVETGNLDELVSARSDIKYILADSTKFKDKSFITYSAISESHLIITDDGVDPSVVAKGKVKGIRIVTV